MHPSACVDDGAEIGAGTKIWHYSHISTGAHIGEGCNIGQNVYVAPGVSIGSHCKIQNNVSVYDGVELGDYVFCGPSMVFTNVQRPRCKYPQASHEFYTPTPVEKARASARTRRLSAATASAKMRLSQPAAS